MYCGRCCAWREQWGVGDMGYVVVCGWQYGVYAGVYVVRTLAVSTVKFRESRNYARSLHSPPHNTVRAAHLLVLGARVRPGLEPIALAHAATRCVGHGKDPAVLGGAAPRRAGRGVDFPGLGVVPVTGARLLLAEQGLFAGRAGG